MACPTEGGIDLINFIFLYSTFSHFHHMLVFVMIYFQTNVNVLTSREKTVYCVTSSKCGLVCVHSLHLLTLRRVSFMQDLVLGSVYWEVIRNESRW